MEGKDGHHEHGDISWKEVRTIFTGVRGWNKGGGRKTRNSGDSNLKKILRANAVNSYWKELNKVETLLILR